MYSNNSSTHGSPQGWSEAVVAQEASCKARYGHRRSLRVHLDTVHSLPSSWDPIVGNKAPSFTEDKEMRNGGMLTRAYRKGERQCDPRDSKCSGSNSNKDQTRRYELLRLRVRATKDHGRTRIKANVQAVGPYGETDV